MIGGAKVIIANVSDRSLLKALIISFKPRRLNRKSKNPFRILKFSLTVPKISSDYTNLFNPDSAFDLMLFQKIILN